MLARREVNGRADRVVKPRELVEGAMERSRAETEGARQARRPKAISLASEQPGSLDAQDGPGEGNEGFERAKEVAQRPESAIEDC